MARVVVRFAGEPDPQVRRKALRDGGALKPGQVKRFVYRGYLVSIVGGAPVTIANAIELGVDCIALWSTVLVNERRNSWAQIRRLPTRRLLHDGELPPSRVVDGERRAGFPAPPRYVTRSLYKHGVVSAQRNGSPADTGSFSHFFAAKLDLCGGAINHAVCQPLFPHDTYTEDTATPWLHGGAFYSSRLSVLSWRAAGARGVEIDDDWVSAELGGDYVFCGLADREPQDGWNSPNLVNREWLVVGPTPTPRQRTEPRDGGGLGNPDNNLPHTVTRGCTNAWRQNCLPGVYASADTLVVAAPCYRLDDGMFVMRLKGYDFGTASEREGYISTRSLWWNYGPIPLVPQAGEATLVIMRFDQQPTTEEEVARFGDATYYSPDVRYVGRWGSGLRSFIGQPTLGSPAPAWNGAHPLSILDLPPWCHPGLCSTMSQYIRAEFPFVPEVLSDHRMPGVFGAVYTTEVDGVVEFAFSVRAAAPASVYIGPDRRETPQPDPPDLPIYPNTAAIVVNKTCLAFVTIDPADPAVAPTVRIDFRDVIGPADCAEFDGSMDPSTAFLPGVKFATTLGGKRTYAVRAVRYRRTPFLASGRSRMLFSSPSYTVRSYKGRPTVWGPVFSTDRAFGPYPDTANYEELWVVVDGEKYRVDVTALGGGLEYASGAKFNYVTYLPYDSRGSYRLVLKSQRMGMFTESEDSDFELLDHFADEEAPAGMEDCGFAKVSETDLMFLVYRPNQGPTPGQLRVCRFSLTTGSAQVVYSMNSTANLGALTCYQQEVVADGELVPAHLLLRVGRNLEGTVYRSTDGGLTWETLYTDESTKEVPDGTPSLGLHVLSVVGQVSDPHNILRLQPEED